MTKTLGMVVAAQMALFATPVIAGEPPANDAPDRTANVERPGYEGSAPWTRTDADASGDRSHGADVQAPGAGSGEPQADATARERALQEEQERQFVEQTWTGP